MWLIVWSLLATLLARRRARRLGADLDGPSVPLRPPLAQALPPLGPDAPRCEVADDEARHTHAAALLQALRQAIARQQPLEIVYHTAGVAVPTTRIIRPLRLEGHGDCWYLHAYCALRQAERVFRLDRIGALTALHAARRPPGRPRRAAHDPRAAPAAGSEIRRTRPLAPRAGFFAPAPDPPPGSPLVRVWLAD